MKKFFLASVALFIFLIASQKSNAQAGVKVGLFDIDQMVQALPDYRNVDSLTAQYEQDSLSAEYQNYLAEYQRLDSTYKADSAAKRPQSVLDYSKNLKQQMGFNLAYWQQIAQQKSNNFRGQLAQPLYAKVVAAYKKVLAAKKYDIILKPSSVEFGTNMENLFPLVAREMGVTIDQGLMADPNKILQDVPNTGGSPATAPAQKPATKPTGKP